MAGTLVITDIKLRTIRKVTLAWVSTAGGAVSGNLTAVLSGVIERVVFIPDSGGTQPDDLYDIVLNDTDGLDVLNAKGSNLSESATTQVGLAFTGGNMAVDDALDLVVSNAGGSNGGKVILYIR